MASQTILPAYESQRQSKDVEYPEATDAFSKPAVPEYIDNNLWRQIDRWVNEGGAVDNGIAPSAKA